jgi:hypothetical protein
LIVIIHVKFSPAAAAAAAAAEGGLAFGFERLVFCTAARGATVDFGRVELSVSGTVILT